MAAGQDPCNGEAGNNCLLNFISLFFDFLSRELNNTVPAYTDIDSLINAYIIEVLLSPTLVESYLIDKSVYPYIPKMYITTKVPVEVMQPESTVSI